MEAAVLGDLLGSHHHTGQKEVALREVRTADAGTLQMAAHHTVVVAHRALHDHRTEAVVGCCRSRHRTVAQGAALAEVGSGRAEDHWTQTAGMTECCAEIDDAGSVAGNGTIVRCLGEEQNH